MQGSVNIVQYPYYVQALAIDDTGIECGAT